MGDLNRLAEAFAYPTPGRLESLRRLTPGLANNETRRLVEGFLDAVGQLSIGEWEECYTRTFDLNPAVAPYFGYQIWGDSYPRGDFMARLSRGLRELDLESSGELPDHLVPVLRFLDAVPEIPLEIAGVIDPALDKMIAALRRTDPDNPYLQLLTAARTMARLETDRRAAHPKDEKSKEVAV